jgi:plastocyanin
MELGPGLYEIECLVDGHDDMGMEGILEVRADAPLQKVEKPTADRSDLVTIADFNFTPAVLAVAPGTELTWTNDDVAPHTVTATSEAFDSDRLDPGDSFSFRFDTPGTFEYRCLIHPDMQGSVQVR